MLLVHLSRTRREPADEQKVDRSHKADKAAPSGEKSRVSEVDAPHPTSAPHGGVASFDRGPAPDTGLAPRAPGVRSTAEIPPAVRRGLSGAAAAEPSDGGSKPLPTSEQLEKHIGTGRYVRSGSRGEQVSEAQHLLGEHGF